MADPSKPDDPSDIPDPTSEQGKARSAEDERFLKSQLAKDVASSPEFRKTVDEQRSVRDFWKSVSNGTASQRQLEARVKKIREVQDNLKEQRRIRDSIKKATNPPSFPSHDPLSNFLDEQRERETQRDLLDRELEAILESDKPEPENIGKQLLEHSGTTPPPYPLAIHVQDAMSPATDHITAQDKSARIQFILGLCIGLLPWGLSLIGFTINIWFGCFILAATFILIAHAFWVWERARRWPMPLRLLTIAFAFIFSAGFVGKQVITQYRQEHSEPVVVSLECNFTVLPISVSADSPLHLVELFPSLLNGVTDFVSANPRVWPSPDAFGMAYRCQFANRGTLPISLETSLQVAFREVVATTSPGVTEPGRVVASHDHRVEIPVLEVPNGKYVFYIVNRSPLIGEVRLPEVAVIQGPDHKDRRQIQLMESGTVPVSLSFPAAHEK
jgi:hypothetical protein